MLGLVVWQALVVQRADPHRWMRTWEPGCPQLVDSGWREFHTATPTTPIHSSTVSSMARWIPDGPGLAVVFPRIDLGYAPIQRWDVTGTPEPFLKLPSSEILEAWNTPAALWVLLREYDPADPAPWPAVVGWSMCELDPGTWQVRRRVPVPPPIDAPDPAATWNWYGMSAPNDAESLRLLGGWVWPLSTPRDNNQTRSLLVAASFDLFSGTIIDLWSRKQEAGVQSPHVIAGRGEHLPRLGRDLTLISVFDAPDFTLDAHLREWLLPRHAPNPPRLELRSRQAGVSSLRPREDWRAVDWDQSGPGWMRIGLELKPAPRVDPRSTTWIPRVLSTLGLGIPQALQTERKRGIPATDAALLAWRATDGTVTQTELGGDWAQLLSWEYTRMNSTPTVTFALDAETALILQVIRGLERPEFAPAEQGVLRLGTLTRGTTTINWRGWVALPPLNPEFQVIESSPLAQPEIYLDRTGLRLALTAGKHPLHHRQLTHRPHIFLWTTIPLPADWQWGHLEGWLGPRAPEAPQQALPVR